MSQFKAGFVGLVGMPNSGKSTLVNALIGEKVSIVTSKPQTTRRRILGITGDETFQAVFVDAPGVVGGTSELNEFLEAEYKKVISDSDVLLAVLHLDESKPERLIRILNLVRSAQKPWAVVITKKDIGTDNRIGFLKAETLNDKVPTLIVSATDNPKQTALEVLETVKSLLPDAAEPLYDNDIPTTETLRDMAAEIIREKCFEELSDELPYGLAVKIMKYEEVPNRATRITADIIVDKSSHKPMVIGKGGEKIKKIGSLARQDIEKLLDNQVYLELHVIVKEKWAKNKNIMKDLRYVIQE